MKRNIHFSFWRSLLGAIGGQTLVIEQGVCYIELDVVQFFNSERNGKHTHCTSHLLKPFLNLQRFAFLKYQFQAAYIV